MVPTSTAVRLCALRFGVAIAMCECVAERCVEAAALVEASLVARTFHLPYATAVLALLSSIRTTLGYMETKKNAPENISCYIV